MRRGKILNDVGRGFVKAGKAAKTGAYYTGRGALAAATLGLSEKRARNAYYKAGKSIPTAAKYAGRGALAAATLGLSEKRARNAYYKAGKSIPTAAKYAGRALTLGMSKKASNA